MSVRLVAVVPGGVQPVIARPAAADRLRTLHTTLPIVREILARSRLRGETIVSTS